MNSNEIYNIAAPRTGLDKDSDPSIVDSEKGLYTHARNALLFSHQGNSVFLQNEPSTERCATSTYEVIGAVSLGNSKFAIFSTNDFDSEIGIFDKSACTYEKVVNSRCLNFKTTHLVKGVRKDNFDCSQSVYFTDGLNPRRVINLSNIPYKYKEVERSGEACLVREYTDELDCQELLVDKKINYPKINVSLGKAVGNLKNGSYQVALAYTINRQRVSDYLGVSTPQPIFTHENFGQSIEVRINNLDRDFKEYELVVIYTVNNQTTAEIVGYYSTQQNSVLVTSVGNTATSNAPINLSDLYIPRPYYNTADNVVTSGDHLLWSNPTTRAELNYQQTAMEIVPKWVAYKVPADYYKKGGNIVGYMRDEVYAFYIQWLYDTGHWSPAYHIPGRVAEGDDLSSVAGYDVFEMQDRDSRPDQPLKKYQVYNTAGDAEQAIVDNVKNYSIIAEGTMAYWESSERYPDNKNLYGDFACSPVRHCKFPDNAKIHTHLNTGDDPGVVILGVKFDNIKHPVDSKGSKISDIVGYRILRADRKNNKSIIAKGLLFNTGEYRFPGSEDRYLYPNYPYNDLRADPYLSSTPVKGGVKGEGYTALNNYKRDIFTFHSPSTSFNRIQLGNELKIEGEQYGRVTGKFEDVYKHPRHKLIRDFALVMSALLGVGEGVLAIRGKKTYELRDPTFTSPGFLLAGPSSTIPGAGAVAAAAYNGYLAQLAGQRALGILTGNVDSIVSSIIPSLDIPNIASANTATTLASGLGGFQMHGVATQRTETAADNMPGVLGVSQKIITFGYYFMQGTSTAINVIRSFLPYEQYAKQYVSHGFFNRYIAPKVGNMRRKIEHYEYLYPVLQQVENFKVNNFKRESSVIVRLGRELEDPTIGDNTRQTIGTSNSCSDPDKEINTTASCFYASIKNANPAQYGQIDSPTILDTGYLQFVDGSDVYTSGAVFGGDTYINRFTQKRKMHFFNQFAFNERDGHEFDYRKYYNIPYARFWVDTFEYDLGDLIGLKLPNDKHALDCRKKNSSGVKLKDLSTLFRIKGAYFYLFCSGVIDFYVESEYNLDYRDYEDTMQGRHYDSREYTNLSDLFRSDIIDRDNVYIYDKSLSKELTEVYAEKQSFDYDPAIYDTCYTQFKNRVIYSLPSNQEGRDDNWRIYLAGNKYDFTKVAGNLTGIRFLERSSALFFFDSGAPYLHRTIDTLQTDANLKLTIGDGGLFSTPPQRIISTDYSYGACQSSNAFVKTKFGLFYPSQDQGKVFLFDGQQLNEISAKGMSKWFSENLPCKLTKDFPNFVHKDNPVIGVGMLATYDSTYETLYLCKRDFRLRESFLGQVTYDPSRNRFSYGNVAIRLGDPNFFEDASWTVSYNMLTQSWISFHDWHPDFLIQSDNHFVSVYDNIFWRHNELCNSYCNFYGSSSPFEVEYVSSTGADVSILRNVEYSLECYKYYSRCDDYQHLLDYNFDQAIIHNTEQISGVLNLNLQIKNKIKSADFYPQISPKAIAIEYTKEENKYRFNQFWDIANNRGEFTETFQPMFITKANGYTKEINPRYVNYGKLPYERKKFRHFWNKIFLRKIKSDDVKMIFKFAINKNVKSFR